MKASANPGIDPVRMYNKDELKEITGWGEGAIRTARQQGLQVLYTGNRMFVRGAAIIDYIERNGDGEYRGGAVA